MENRLLIHKHVDFNVKSIGLRKVKKNLMLKSRNR